MQVSFTLSCTFLQTSTFLKLECILEMTMHPNFVGSLFFLSGV